MKLDVSKLPLNKEYIEEESIVFNDEKFVCHYPLESVESCLSKIKVQKFDEFIYVTLSIKAKVTLICSLTNKPFKSEIIGNDELHFSPFKDEEDDDLICFNGNVIDLDKYIFDLLSASIPTAPVSKNAKINKIGEGYRIISDEELSSEKEEAGNSKFDALKDLDFD